MCVRERGGRDKLAQCTEQMKITDYNVLETIINAHWMASAKPKTWFTTQWGGLISSIAGGSNHTVSYSNPVRQI